MGRWDEQLCPVFPFLQSAYNLLRVGTQPTFNDTTDSDI